LIVLVRQSWTGYVAAAFLVAPALFGISDLLWPDDVMLAALREGCRSRFATLFDAAVLTCCAFAFIWWGHYTAKRPVVA
jgi:hypothetical protein